MPVQVIRQYERGVRLTFGRNPKLVEPGLRFKFPLAQEMFTVQVMPETISCGPVHVTTEDHKTITVQPMVEYVIEDPVKWLLGANDSASNLRDLAKGITADYLTDINWETARKKPTLTAIKRKLNDKAEEMGGRVTLVMFTDLCQNKVILTSI